MDLSDTPDQNDQSRNKVAVTEETYTVWAALIKTISHEFRTPLTVINTSVNLLRDHYNQLSEEKRDSHFDNISDSISNLILMLNEISSVDSIHAKEVETNPGAYTFMEACQAFKKYFQNQSRLNCLIDPKVPSSQTIILDLSLVFQILDPIVNNALTYSEKDCDLTVTMNMETMPAELVIIVEDKGMGIEGEDLPQIFDMFYRSPRSEFHRGLGLGLYVSKRLADTLNGKIEVLSTEVNAGSTIQVSLPLINQKEQLS